MHTQYTMPETTAEHRGKLNTKFTLLTDKFGFENAEQLLWHIAVFSCKIHQLLKVDSVVWDDKIKPHKEIFLLFPFKGK